MRELEIQLIHEWREQIGRFTLGILDYESEEEPENFDFKSKQPRDNPNSSIEKEKSEKMRAQLANMAEQLKRLIHLNEAKENEQLEESHPLCSRIRSKIWKGKDIDFDKYNGMSDPRMHIVIFEEATCSHQHDVDMLARLFQLSLGEENCKIQKLE